MLRFKTKQELEKIFKPDIVDVLHVPYGEPTDVSISSHLTTTDPHPYEGHTITILTPSVTASEAAQEKLFALGYKWEGQNPTRPSNLWEKELCIHEGRIYFNPVGDEEFTVTLVQLREGYLSFREPDAWTIHQNWIIDNLEVKAVPDAYIDTEFTLHSIENGQHFRTDVREAYKYNLMSEEVFKEKYPDPLKFKEWEVTPRNASIKIGCETVLKQDLKIFSKVLQKLNKHKVDPNDAYVFLYTNQKELGLSL